MCFTFVPKNFENNNNANDIFLVSLFKRLNTEICTKYSLCTIGFKWLKNENIIIYIRVKEGKKIQGANLIYIFCFVLLKRIHNLTQWTSPPVMVTDWDEEDGFLLSVNSTKLKSMFNLYLVTVIMSLVQISTGKLN